MNQEIALFRRGINKRIKELPTHKQKYSQYVCSSDEEPSQKEEESEIAPEDETKITYEPLPTSNWNYKGVDDKTEFSELQAQNKWMNYTSYLTTYRED
jgi:hypothetical protein